MAIGIDPTVDYAFKRMLGTPSRTDITVHFLNAVLAGAPRITEVTILNPHLGKKSANDKLSVLDVRATDEHGRQLNIEMQTSLPAGMKDRLAYYASYLFVDQLEAGGDYAELRAAISICVLGVSLYPHLPDLHLDFRMRERQHAVTLTDGLQIHLIELPKCSWQAHNVSKASTLEKWAYFLKHAECLSPQEVISQLQEPEFIQAAEVLEMIAKTPQEKMLYEARVKFQRDEAWRLLHATKEGHEKGLEEGLEKGLEQGLELGLRKGLVTQIHVFQQLLGLPSVSESDLLSQSTSQLQALADDLQHQLRKRGG